MTQNQAEVLVATGILLVGSAGIYFLATWISKGEKK